MALPLLSFQSNVAQTYLETTPLTSLPNDIAGVCWNLWSSNQGQTQWLWPKGHEASHWPGCLQGEWMSVFISSCKCFHLILFSTDISWCYLSSRSIQACLMKSTSCPPVYAQAAVSVASAFPLPAAALSDVKSKGSRSRPWLAWRETSLVITTAWMKWLNKSSRDLSTWVASIKFFQSRDILVLGW